MRSISIEKIPNTPFAMLAEEGDDQEEDKRKISRGFPLFSFSFNSSRHLELAFIAAGDNDIVDLEHHAAQLGGEQELLALGDERVDDEG